MNKRSTMIVVGLLLILLGLWIMIALTGCASTEKVGKLDVLWVCPDGVFHMTGIGMEKTQSIVNAWDFTQCEVVVDKSEGK